MMVIFAVCAAALTSFFALFFFEEKNQEVTASYKPKDFSSLKGMKGFSDKALKMHFGLYEGYVKNTNLVLEKLKEMEAGDQFNTPEYNELKRRFGWEFNGMRLHEYYFGNLGGKEDLSKDSPLYKALEKQFGSFENWKKDLLANGKVRGIGWVVMMYDYMSGKLINTWINEHDAGVLAGGMPVLVMDLFEHAYIPDYETDRGSYMDAFYENVDWEAVEKRFNCCQEKD